MASVVGWAGAYVDGAGDLTFDTEGPNMGALADGDFGLIVHRGDDDAPTFGQAAGNSGWTELDQIGATSGTDSREQVLWKADLSASEADPGVTTDTDDHHGGVLIVLRGIDTSTPFDVTYVRADHFEENANTQEGPNPPITTNSDGATIVLIHGVTTSEDAFAGGTPGPPSPYTYVVGYGNPRSSVEIAVLLDAGAAGTKTPGVWTTTGPGFGGGSEERMFTLALKAATGGGGPTVHEPSGGLIVGGSAAPSAAYPRTAAGGVDVGGTSASSAVLFPPASGGLIVGGAATWSAVLFPQASGGLVAGGAVTPVTPGNTTHDPAGGLIVGGAATWSAVLFPPASGGVDVGGSAAPSAAYPRTAAGGVDVGGTSASSAVLFPPASGGLIVGGAVTPGFTGGTIVHDPAGGVDVGGTSASSAVLFPPASGGVDVGGSAAPSAAYPRTAAGGVDVGGTVTPGFTAGTIAHTPTGGLIVAASADLFASWVTITAGGLMADGAADASFIGALDAPFFVSLARPIVRFRSRLAGPRFVSTDQ